MARLIFILLALACPAALAQALLPMAPPVDPLLEYRQCGVPARNASGVILRNPSVIRAYKKYHPCPATLLTTGACPGWAVNHTIPLAKGGCDAVINLSWQPLQIKSCALSYCTDRWERTYYGLPHGKVTLP